MNDMNEITMFNSKAATKIEITSAPNFNDEENPIVNYVFDYQDSPHQQLTSLTLSIVVPGGIGINLGEVPRKTTIYTCVLSESNRDILRGNAKNSNTLNVNFVLRALYSNTNVQTSTLSRTMTIVNANPIFSEFDYKDTNTNVNNVLGNNKLFVKGISNLAVIISSNNKMTAIKKANPKNYVATIENLNKSIDYEDANIEETIGILQTFGTKRLTVRAYDSRNNSTAVGKDIFVYDYEKPVINATASRLNNFENQTTLKIKGSFSSLIVNDVEKNDTVSIQYRYKEVNGDWGEWNNLLGTIEDNKFTCDDVILSLDNKKAFDFEIKVVDNLSDNTISLTVDVGEPIFFISNNKRKCYINWKEIVTNVYKDGDNYSPDYYCALPGIITNNLKDLNITVTTPKSLMNINKIICNSLTAIFYGIKGALNNSNSYYHYELDNNYSITCTKINDYAFNLKIQKSSDWTNATTNTPIMMYLNSSANFLFNPPNLGDVILSKYSNITERTNFSNIVTTANLYKTTDYTASGSFTGTSYYYTGNPDNWVSFAGKLWRIIRINGDGSVRLLYAGTGREDGYLKPADITNSSAVNMDSNGGMSYNPTYNNSMYVGWKYGTSGSLENNRTNTTESPIYKAVKDWYNKNIVTPGYEKYISKTAIYCNDRTVGAGTYSATGSTFYYAAYTRLSANKTPTLECSNTNDRFKEGFGLMTADEVSFAGGVYSRNNASTYYYLNGSGGSSAGTHWWWTMSPCYWFNSARAYMFRVYGSDYSGSLSDVNVNASSGTVRPVISLKSNVIFIEGDGSFSNPYKVLI